ncbi:MAG: hypothetical protein ACYSTL_04050 [Planctomycetota bacterium]|jgi:hypothetical protein
MNTLILSPTTEQQRVVQSQVAAIYVDGKRRRDLQLLKWEVLPAPEFGKVTLSLAGSFAARRAVRLGDPTRLPPIGSKVKIKPSAIFRGANFIGSVTAHSIVVNEQTERFVAECRHQLASDLDSRICSLWEYNGESLAEIKQAKVQFNVDLNTLATESLVTIANRSCRAFTAEADARSWSVTDALGYLLATGVAGEVEVPTLAELDALVGEIDLGQLDVTGLTVAEALAEVANRGGLAIRAAQTGRGLIFYRPGKEGARRHVRLQTAGSTLSTDKSNLWKSQINIRRRPSRPGLLVLGQRKRYESTFELSKGWDTSLETDRWRDFVRSMSDNWSSLAGVYRKWVLNEQGWYSQSPWNLSVHSFANISPNDFQMRVARRFLPCLSTDIEGQSLGIVVEIRCGVSADWQMWRGPLWVAEDECSIYLGGDALPGDFFQAVTADEASVRITSTVEADGRLIAEVEGDPNAPREVIDLTDRAAWAAVHTESIFKNAQGVGTPDERDESELLQGLALRHTEVTSLATEAEFTLGWIDISFQVGDVVERIDGREFELSSNPDTRPFVRLVMHDFDAQSTQLLVSG